MNRYPCSYRGRSLEEIKDKLQATLEKIGTVGYEENDADVRAVDKLAEDTKDAVIEYHNCALRVSLSIVRLDSFQQLTNFLRTPVRLLSALF